jgi:hypothetical protein
MPLNVAYFRAPDIPFLTCNLQNFWLKLLTSVGEAGSLGDHS